MFEKHPLANNGESEPKRAVAILLIVVIAFACLASLVLPWLVMRVSP